MTKELKTTPQETQSCARRLTMCCSVSLPLLQQILLTFLVSLLDFMNETIGCLLVNNQKGKGHGITDKGAASLSAVTRSKQLVHCFLLPPTLNQSSTLY